MPDNEQKFFIDGTPIPPGYEAAVSKLVDDANDAEDRCTLDELEEHAKTLVLRTRPIEAEA